MSSQKVKAKIHAILGVAKVKDRNHKLEVYRFILWRPDIDSTNDLDDEDLKVVADTLSYWERCGPEVLADGVQMRYPYRVDPPKEEPK
jgi:hypothetical protein